MSGATSSLGGYTAENGGQIQLSSIAFNSPGDRFTISSNSIITANSAASGLGLSSLTRVATLTGPGQVVLSPDAIVGFTSNLPGPLSSASLINNLGTNADLLLGVGAQTSSAGSITIGVGTPFHGISSIASGVASGRVGTVFVTAGTTDFVLNSFTGGTGGTGSNLLSIGNGSAAGSVTIASQGTGPVNAHVRGTNVSLNDDTSVFGGPAAPLTFVVDPGGTLALQSGNALGSGTGLASVRVTNGGSLNPASPTAINGAVRIEAGGRFQPSSPASRARARSPLSRVRS